MRQKSIRQTNRTLKQKSPAYLYEAEVVPGLEAIAYDEIKTVAGIQALRIMGCKPGIIRFRYTGHTRELFRLKTVTAVYLVHQFPIPRPRALLGHEHFQALLRDITSIRTLHPTGTFQTLHLDAAGSNSSVMQRFREELALSTGLKADQQAGDLLIRLRRPIDGSEGWETLIRLTPRPLATRSWRVCNLEGALNASVAHAVSLLTEPDERDVFLNIASGSGTILIERLSNAPARQAIGCDHDTPVLECARANMKHSSVGEAITLTQADARALPFPRSSIDALCADLPFGQLVGSHEENRTLYPLILQEAARVAKPGARFVLITHEVRLMEAVLHQSHTWLTENVIQITLRGLHPRIFVLRRGSAIS